MNVSLNTTEIRHLDTVAQHRFGLPGLLLMEHASLGIAEILEGVSARRSGGVLFLCGKGNNGGDGFAAARHLHNRGLPVEIALAGRLDQIPKASDAAVNAGIARRMGIPLFECESSERLLELLDRSAPGCVVDAVLGTGLSSPVAGMYREIFEGLNTRGLDITAVDVPSGLNGDTGLPLGIAVRAARTVTLGFMKTGLLKPEAAEWCGEIILKGIGLPREMCADPRSYL